MKSKILLKLNYHTYFFFILYFIIGILIYKDYGISFDENINRTNGFVTLKYIVQLFNLDINLNSFHKNIPNIFDYTDKEYGVVFDLPLAALEVFFGIKESQNIFFLRHLMTFIIFYISSISFYFLCLKLFKDKTLSIIGFFFLILSPRIFAQSFYNPKDIIFLSFFIFALFFNLKFLYSQKNTNIFFAALFSALMTDIRVIGIFLPFLTIFFIFLNTNKESLKTKIYISSKYFLIFLVFLFIFWPFLWGNGFLNLLNAINEFKNYPWMGDVLYNGKFINAKFVPWHYFFVWFIITTPVLFSLIIFSGLFLALKIFFINLINIEKNRFKNFWNNYSEMVLIYFFFIFFIPIFLVILLNSTLYTGWRQLYFLYPPLIILGIYFLKYIKESRKIYFKIFLFLFAVQSIFLVYFIAKNHPHQHVYFNKFANVLIKDKFSYDYWGVSNHTTIKFLLDSKNLSFPIKISSASFTDLNKTKLILDKNYQNKFIFVADNHDEADFIFSNFYYYKNPIFDRKRFEIPANFKSYYKFKVDEKVINELYINSLKYN